MMVPPTTGTPFARSFPGSFPFVVEVVAVPSEESSDFSGTTSSAYERFMGRYSMMLAPMLADQAGVAAPMDVLDVGCGSGALTRELVRRLDPSSVAACDPSPAFVADCRAQFPGATVVPGSAEALPFETNRFDATLSQLVIHFMSDPDQATAEMKRVTKPGGCVASSTWDTTGAMELLTYCDEAASMVDASKGPFLTPRAFGEPGWVADVFERIGLESVDEQRHTISVPYTDFDDFWTSIGGAGGSLGVFVRGCAPDELSRLRAVLFDRVGSPSGSFALSAMARSISGRVP